jgi:uncharacterized membrane protein
MNRWLLISIVLTLLAAVSAVVVYVNREAWLPEKVPTHWGVRGEPDAFVERDAILPMLLILPGMMAFMVLLSLALPWLSPKQFSIETFRGTYNYLMALLVFLFGYIHCVALAAQMQAQFDMVRWLVGGILLILAALGNVLGKVKRNFYVGVKTPWTLASDVVWTRTHRLAAWLMVSGGIIGAALVLIGVNPLVGLGVFLVAAIAPIFYSLWLYKHLEKAGRLDKVDTPAG